MNKQKLPLTESEQKALQSLENHVQTTPVSSSELDNQLKDWCNSSKHDNSPKFELDYNGEAIFIDMLTLLQCLKIAEHTHHIPQIDSEWWLKIMKLYPVEVHLDGRIQTKNE